MEKYFEEEWRQKWFSIMIEFYGDSTLPISCFWFGLSSNPNATMEFIFANANYPWDWYGVSENCNLTLKIVLENPNKSWHWRSLTENPSITDSQMDNHPELPWITCETMIHGETYETYLPKRLQKSDSIAKIDFRFLDMPKEDEYWIYGRISYADNLPLKIVVSHVEKFKEYGYVTSIVTNTFATDKHYYILHYIKWMYLITIYETHIENAKTIDCSSLSSIERILFDEFLVATLLKW